LLLETIASIPSSLRFMPQKKLLIASVPELPDWVINKQKRGFSFPFPAWIKDEWHECFAGLDSYQDIHLGIWYRRWSLALLDYWWQKVSQ